MREQPDLEIAIERFDLRGFLSRHGFQFVGRGKSEALADCPWCYGEDKLSVNVQTRERRCFVCRKRFKLLDLVAKLEGGYRQAVDVVLSETGVFYSLDFIPDLMMREHSSMLRDALWEPTPILPPPHWRPLMEHHPYTAKRGFPIENILRLGVGVCGWGRYQDRLVFPVRRLDGTWVYFQTRATWEKADQAPDADGKVRYRKNMNPESIGPDYADAGDVLLGLEHAYRWGRIAVVEGPTDWLMAGPAAVATFGKVISERQIQLLVQAGIREIDLAYDPDAWDLPLAPDGRPTGRRPPAEIAAEKLVNAGFFVRVVRYEPKRDPGNTSPQENMELRMQARPFGDGSRLMFV